MSNDITAAGSLIQIISQSRQNALKKVNEELINMYWRVGEYLSTESAKASFGDAYIDSIAEEIQDAFPGIKGFDRRGLYRMKKFYETYKDDEFVTKLLSQISWSNHLAILSKAKTEEERHFYILLSKFSTEVCRNASRPPMYYNLDVIISVGYRVKSKRGVEFRKWANRVLKDYILRGYAINESRVKQLGEVVRLMKRTQNDLDSQQVLTVIEWYSATLDLLDDYDHQTMKRPKGTESAYVLTYEECRGVINQMRFGNESDLFGRKRMIPSREVSAISTSPLVGRRSTPLWRRRLPICCTL